MSGSAVIGNNSTASGSQVTVDASTWSNTGSLSVGSFGKGTLLIQHGGKFNGGATVIGSSTGSAGSAAIIDGPTSVWTA